MGDLKILFFLGKGGVGKSTTSALLSMYLSQKGKKVLLASFDYAHNQSDIFEREISDKAEKITPFLDVMQVNRDREIKSFLKKTTSDMKKNYTYLTSFNLEGYLNVLKYSPGMEEYALVTTFMKVRSTALKKYDYLIIDMPPTALALRFFNLPFLTLTWLSELEKLRLAIYKKKEIVSKIRFGKKEIETDRVLKGLITIKKEYEELKEIFLSPEKSQIYNVFNEDKLSQNETSRIVEQLGSFEVKVDGFVCNRRSEVTSDFNPQTSFPYKGIYQNLPYSVNPLIGKDSLERYLELMKPDFSHFV